MGEKVQPSLRVCRASVRMPGREEKEEKKKGRRGREEKEGNITELRKIATQG